MNQYQRAAHHLHDLGCNVTAIKVREKRPAHPWERWQTAQQALDDVNALPWRDAGGVGVISGVGGLRVFDFDDCPDIAPAASVLTELGLPTTYPWLCRSGSGNGWSITVRCDDELPAGVLSTNGKGPGVYKAPGQGFDHLELRWKECQTVLPPSLHPTGPGYRWYNVEPTEPPARVTAQQIVDAFLAVTIRESSVPIPAEPPQRTYSPKANGYGPETERAGDEYARTHSWADILGPHGWRFHHSNGTASYWTRPGKDLKEGLSAATGGDYDVLWVWSTNAHPFEPGTSYSKWGAYALLEHGGDFRAAARHIYGLRPEAEAQRYGSLCHYDLPDGAGETAHLPEWTTPATRPTSARMPTVGKPATPTDDELAARWLAEYPNTAWGLGEFRRYLGGIWNFVPLDVIRREVKKVLEAAKVEGVRPSARSLASVLELARVEIAHPAEEWDADPDILVCTNGVLHIPTRTLQAHSPHYYATSGLPFAYDPTARAEVWQHVLDTCAGDQQTFLQEFAGYAVTTDTRYEIALWLAGAPGGGKSTVLQGFTTMLGPRVCLLGLADIEKSRFALTNLPGKTLAISTEQPGGYVAAAQTLNALISGEPITVDRKYRDPVTIIPRAKIAWAMNELPRVGPEGAGLFRRVKVVRFPPIPQDQRDPEIKERVKLEGAGILNWALDGLDRLRERGEFDIPQVVKDSTDDFRETNDIPAAFVAECCIVGSDPKSRQPYRTQGGVLYKAYSEWCRENGHKPQSSTSIAEDWRRLGFERYKAMGKSWWRNVGVVEAVGTCAP